jgi:hypothetical protein
MAFRGVAAVAAVMTEEAVVVIASLLLIPIFVTTFGMATTIDWYDKLIGDS